MKIPCEKLECPCSTPQKSLGRIVHLSKLNGYVYVRDGNIKKIGSKNLWGSHFDLYQEAKSRVECVSDKIFRTDI